MTWYEVIISRRGEPGGIVINGRGKLIVAIDCLDAMAQRGELGDRTNVYLYDNVELPSSLLIQLLIDLNQPHDWVEEDKIYNVYLSEV